MCCHSCTPCLYSCFVLTRIVLFFLLLFFFFLLLPSLFLCLFSFAVVLDATTKQWKCVFAKVFLEMGNLPNLVKLITTAARTNGISRAQKTSSGFTARHAQPAMANHPRLWRVTMMLPCRKSGQLRWRLRMLLVLLVPQNLAAIPCFGVALVVLRVVSPESGYRKIFLPHSLHSCIGVSMIDLRRTRRWTRQLINHGQ